MLYVRVKVQKENGHRSHTDIFYYEFKLHHKAVEAEKNINTVFVNHILKERTTMVLKSQI